MEILCRRTKPNVIVVGEAGVGKTALIDGFALDLIHDRVGSFFPPSPSGFRRRFGGRACG